MGFKIGWLTWEQRKFSDIYKKSSEKNDLSFSKDKVISVANNKWGTAPKNSTDKYMRTYYVYRIGDIAFEGNKSKKFKFGRFVENTLANGIVSHVFDIYRPTQKEHDLWFWKYYIHNENIMRDVLRKSTTKATMMTNLVNKDLLKQKLNIPILEEQKKIGRLFNQIDRTITLHEEKQRQLEQLKKALLQKMFADKKHPKPELRFKGFSGDWEQRKLGEVFNQTLEYINPNEANLELWSVTVERGLTPKTARYNREALVKKNDKFKVVHDGDIVYNPMNLTIGAVGFNKSEKSVAVSGYYVTMNMNSGFNNSYFQTWLKSENAIKQYKLYATGSLIEKQRVQFPTLSLIKSYIPTFEEQQKIGSLLDKLDETINVNSKLLNQLKVLKKSLLQNMFI